jgi:hypothetical protein
MIEHLKSSDSIVFDLLKLKTLIEIRQTDKAGRSVSLKFS